MQTLGRFQLERILGQGATGTVHLARDKFTGNQVALKVLDPSLFKRADIDRVHLNQFLNEASLAGKLSHPHIAAILEASITDDVSYIAVEYVPGGNLDQYTLQENLLPLEDVIEIAFKSCGALDYAFSQGIVHRDIKPANILMVRGTNIKVADFGAAFVRQNIGKSQVMRIGSPYYMSPEQIRGEVLGFYTDMYALGVVLYQLFTGRRPFDAFSREDLFAKILDGTPLAPSTLRAGVSTDIDAVLARMLAKKPDERYASWADLALDIARIGRLSVYHNAISDSAKFGALKAVPVLGRLDDAQIWELVHAGRWSRMPSRTPIVREGEPGGSLFIIGGGQVKVTRQGRLLDMLNAGDCFGEMSYVKEGAITRHATVESITDMLLVEFEKKILDKVSLTCRYQLLLAMAHALVDRLMFANERVTRAG